MDPIERLLAKIQQDSTQSVEPQVAPQPVIQPMHADEEKPSTNRSLDDLLHELNIQSVQATPSSQLPSTPPPSLDRLLDQISPVAKPGRSTSSQPPDKPPIPLARTTPNTTTTKQAEQRQRQRLQAEQRRQYKQRQRQQAILRRQAENWLQQITPNTEEWLWFEEFAHHYPSRLEAAMDYLQALHRHST